MLNPTAMLNVQRALSKGQAIPIIGLAVSPVKAAVSIAQMIAGIAGTIFFGVGTFFTHSEYLAGKTAQSLGQAGLGVVGTIYSFANLLSLGFIGYTFENWTTTVQNMNI